ncbi:MAG: fused MFS/spermidine synthase, partial [Thiohalomonadales bacterium]
MKNIGTKNSFYIIFAISGFSGLIYESIWSHYLKLFLGHAAYAQTLVLAIFMGGMAIGAWACAKYSGRWRNLLLYYAAVEALIGVAAIAFHPVFDQTVQFAYSSLLPSMESSEAAGIAKWLIAALLILPQSILLGTTFPLMTAGLIRRFPDDSGKTIGMLYFSNSIGAFFGVLVSGFLLIAWLGLPGTIIFAGILNIILAITVWRLSADQGQEQKKTQASPAIARNSVFFGLVAVAALTGAASFIYEIVWIRMLSLVLGSSTHSFELMLSAFILGLALGGLWIRHNIHRLRNLIKSLAIIQLAMGLLALATLPF